MEQEDYIFALDIGTRTVIGLLLKPDNNGYQIIDSKVIEHETRAMLDGQIHNVNMVASEVAKVKQALEEKNGFELKEVAVAAAGRALKTITREYSIDFESRKYIEEDDVRRLEYTGIQKAQEELARSNPDNQPGDYHFVGYSVIEYLLDDIFLKDLRGQRGKSIQVKLIATFLPRVVIDSLLSVINECGLEVCHLTLEPIAASDLVIPQDMSNFNLALVDIGAGTADIALTKGGSMIGYAMVPVAGDEITEALAEHYMLEYKAAEDVKRRINNEKHIEVRNILGNKINVNSDEAVEAIYPQVKQLASLIEKEILYINQDSPQAVLCIGGGSMTPYLTDELAKNLDLSPERIGVRKAEELDQVNGQIEGVNGSQALTPIGIAINAAQNQSKSVFIDVEVNGRPIQVFGLHDPTISDALLSAEIDIKKLNARPGMGLTCTVNDELITLPGTLGSPGQLLLNGEGAELEDRIKSGDQIQFIAGEKGKDAEGIIADVLPDDAKKRYHIKVDGTEVEIRVVVYQNGKLVGLETPLEDGAEITYNMPETIRDGLAQLLEVKPDVLLQEVLKFSLNGNKQKIPLSKYIIRENGHIIDLDRPLQDDLELEIIENEKQEIKIDDICSINDKESCIEIIFNGSHLEVPTIDWEIKCNGEQVDLDYVIKPGDNIVCQKRPITVSSIFKYINYNLSTDMKEDMELTINGEKAYFTDKVNEGDRVEVKLS